jgi:ribonuclease I
MRLSSRPLATFAALVGFLGWAIYQQWGHVAAKPSRAEFDFYLLAASVHHTFCEDGHRRLTECAANARRGRPALVLHGLWPENLQPGAWPRDCRREAPELSPALTNKLAEWMPGQASDLHVHEWRKHGTCSGLAAEEYFAAALERTRALGLALEPALRSPQPREMRADEIRTLADAQSAGLGDTFVLQCRTLRDAPREHRQRPFLIEVRQCIDDDGPRGAPGKLLRCADVNRRDQGCGRSFLVWGGA